MTKDAFSILKHMITAHSVVAGINKTEKKKNEGASGFLCHTMKLNHVCHLMQTQH